MPLIFALYFTFSTRWISYPSPRWLSFFPLPCCPSSYPSPRCPSSYPSPCWLSFTLLPIRFLFQRRLFGFKRLLTSCFKRRISWSVWWSKRRPAKSCFLRKRSLLVFATWSTFPTTSLFPLTRTSNSSPIFRLYRWRAAWDGWLPIWRDSSCAA